MLTFVAAKDGRNGLRTNGELEMLQFQWWKRGEGDYGRLSSYIWFAIKGDHGDVSRKEENKGDDGRLPR